MPVDVSMYTVPKPYNALETVGQMAGAANALTNNRLMQQEIQARNATGQIYAGALNPDGTIDPSKVAAGIAANPTYAAPDIAQHAATLVGTGISNRTANVDLSAKGANNVYQAWGARAQNTPAGQPITYSQAAQDVTDAVSAGRVDPATGHALLRSIPRDPSKVRPFITRNFVQTLPSAGAGPTQTGVTTEGAPVTGTQGQFVTGATGGAPSEIQSAPLPPIGAQSGANTPSGAPAAAKPQGPAGLVTGLAPGVAQAQTVEAQGGAEQGMALQRTADAAPTRLAALNGMLGDIQDFTSGPLTGRIAHTVAGVNQAFGTNFDLTGVSATERFSKLAKQIALAQAGALHATDLTTETAMGANPSIDFSKLGNQTVIGMLKGNENAIVAKNAAWQAWRAQGHGPGTYGQFEAAFNSVFDPRVFQFTYMSPPEKVSMAKAMTPAERQDFTRKYNVALANGWLQGGQPNAQ